MPKCVDCGNEEVVEVRDGLYYYKCPVCVKYMNEQQHKPDDPRCPKCGSYAYTEVIVSGEFTNEGLAQGMKAFDLWPVRPSEKFICKGCGESWINPEFEKYLLQRVVQVAKI
jgi:NAD-dependent SIR2 family protein deacetylase